MKFNGDCKSSTEINRDTQTMTGVNRCEACISSFGYESAEATVNINLQGGIDGIWNTQICANSSDDKKLVKEGNCDTTQRSCNPAQRQGKTVTFRSCQEHHDPDSDDRIDYDVRKRQGKYWDKSSPFKAFHLPLISKIKAIRNLCRF